MSNYIEYYDYKIYYGVSNNLNSFFQDNMIKKIIRLIDRNEKVTRFYTKIPIIDIVFDSGMSPSDEVIHMMTEILNNMDSNIYIHCNTCIGRVPTLLCISLIHSGMERYDAIDTIRQKIKNSLNNTQLNFLLKYKK